MPSTFKVGAQDHTIERFATPAGPAKRPVVVILHGVDGMVGESETEVRKMAEEIASDGYVVFVPHYIDPGTTRQTSLPPIDVLVQRSAQVDSYRPNIAAAMDHALKQPDADSSRVGLVGISLGGGLALWYAESGGKKVKAVVDFFGYVGDNAIYSKAGTLPPTLVFHNKHDGFVLVSNSDKLIEELEQHKVVHDKEIYDKETYPEKKNHTFRPGGEADRDSRARTRKWLDKHVKP